MALKAEHVGVAKATMDFWSLLTLAVLAGAQRDVIVRSYELLSAVGRLSATQLALNVQTYDPEVHYQAVQNKWHGMKTPDGR